jgi:hypothetical protein
MEFSQTDDFAVDEPVVLFLNFSEADGVYFLMAGPFGAFRVRAAEVVAVSKAAAERRGDVAAALDAFLGDLQRRVNAKR